MTKFLPIMIVFIFTGCLSIDRSELGSLAQIDGEQIHDSFSDQAQPDLTETGVDEGSNEGPDVTETSVDEGPEADKVDTDSGMYIECVIDQDCDDDDPCTINTCEGDECLHTPRIDCCTEEDSTHCIDGNSCTNDLCVDNECVNEWMTGCCLNSSDCDDSNNCTEDSCIDNVCSHDNQCCSADSDCNDNNSCTLDKCLNEKCSNFFNSESCCQADDECQVAPDCQCDGFSVMCKVGKCTNSQCGVETYESEVCDNTCLGGVCIPYQCQVDGDCLPVPDCHFVKCTDNVCDYNPIPGCCTSDLECDDGSLCTTDQCSNGACQNTPTCAYGCEESNGQCLGPECTIDENCYQALDDCACTDSDTVLCKDLGKCIDGTCELLEEIEECDYFCSEGLCSCFVDNDCEDNNLCTIDKCVGQKYCKNSLIAGCD